METLLTFMTSRLRQRGMTVNEFCKRIGISRQKFYRFVKEPSRFPAESVMAVISVLSFDEAEVRQFKSYFEPEQQKSGGPHVSRDHFPKLSDYRSLIDQLFRHELSKELAPNLEKIEFTHSDGLLTMESPASLARMIASAQEGAPPRSHDFTFTIYNCVPAYTKDPEQLSRPVRSIQILAGLMKELEDILIPSSPVQIRIRHYLSALQHARTKGNPPDDPSGIFFHLHVLNAILPLLSMAEDYTLDQSDVLSKTCAEYANLCLIRHTCSAPAQDPFIEYYIFAFSSGDGCRACRLGSGEASHIFRFFAADIRGAERPVVNRRASDPNLFYYEMDRTYRQILLHPDLCFDDIPKPVWLALYKSVEEMDDRFRFRYEAAFRKLMDPFDLYSFLRFGDLVEAMIDTIEKRNRAAAGLGKSVICHPDGLLKMIRTGMISDLSSEASDYRGQYSDLEQLRFPAPMIRILLEIIKSSIQRRMETGITDPSKYDWINYYILQPNYPCPEVSFVIYDNYGVFPLYSKGRHKNQITNAYDSPETGSFLYNFGVKEIIGKRGEKLGSIIMSDEHSLALIDKLNAMLDE